ncbi:MAG: hypothetical protein AB7N76_01270 [Planctomycetota bacterium]
MSGATFAAPATPRDLRPPLEALALRAYYGARAQDLEPEARDLCRDQAELHVWRTRARDLNELEELRLLARDLTRAREAHALAAGVRDRVAERRRELHAEAGRAATSAWELVTWILRTHPELGPEDLDLGAATRLDREAERHARKSEAAMRRLLAIVPLELADAVANAERELAAAEAAARELERLPAQRAELEARVTAMSAPLPAAITAHPSNGETLLAGQGGYSDSDWRQARERQRAEAKQALAAIPAPSRKATAAASAAVEQARAAVEAARAAVLSWAPPR